MKRDAIAKAGLSRVLTAAAVLALATSVASQPAAAKETRSYALAYFGHAVSSKDGDCPGGLNPKLDIQYAKNLQALGLPGKEVEELMKTFGDEGQSWDKNKIGQIMNARARVNGQPENSFAHPAAVADANLKYVAGKVAHGFNLDGRGANDADAFEDPETHEKGIDNQMFRALGCVDPFRGTLATGTAFWLFMWMAEKDSMPAWLITVDGDDLSKDGPVTVSLSRAIEVTKFNANGEARADMTYRQDPDPRTKANVFKGEIKGGVLSVASQGHLYMMQDQLTFPNFDLANFHLKLTSDAEGRMEGLIGGYQPIEQIYFALGQGGLAAENNYSPELPGMYHLMRKLADGPADAQGQKWSISTAYHIRAVPAFVAVKDTNATAKTSDNTANR